MGTYKVWCSVFLGGHITAASRCLNLQHLRYKRGDIPIATERTVRWYWHRQWTVVLRRYRAACLQEEATQFVFGSVRPVHSSEIFLAVWKRLLPRRQCAARTDTRHNIIVHQRLHVSASRLIDLRAVYSRRQYEQKLL